MTSKPVLEKPADIERFFNKVSLPESEAECWEWVGGVTAGGYGQFRMGEHTCYTHRLAYQLLMRVRLETDQVLDHLCRNRRCCNPLHLEVVDNVTNILRGESPYARKKRQTHCINGHVFDERNTYVHPVTGERKCKACRTETMRRMRQRAFAGQRTRTSLTNK
jgi:hypothetical protein